jgi:hypothetical protein
MKRIIYNTVHSFPHACMEYVVGETTRLAKHKFNMNLLSMKRITNVALGSI